MAKVLLVEDDNNLREIYQARLMAEGYDIVTAQNGEEALVVAKQNKPDLIISDVMMPRISGFEMLDILRNTAELKSTKVIMLTALGQEDDQKRADSLGADKYLVKSQVTLEDIVNAAKELLSEDSSTPTATPQPGIMPDPLAVAPAAPSIPAIAHVPDSATPPAPAATQPTSTLPSTPAPAPVTPSMTPTPVAVEPAIPTAGPAPVAMPTPTPATATPILALAASPVATTTSPAAPATAPETAAATPVEEPVAVVPEPPQTPSGPTEPATPPAPAAVDAAAQGLEAEEAALQAQIASYSQAPVTAAATPPAPAAPDAAATEAANDASNAKAIDDAVEQLNSPSEAERVQPPSVANAPAAAPAPVAATPPAPTTLEPAPVSRSSATDNVTVAGKKVIQPINDPTTKPDLNALLAKEEAKEPTPVAPIVNGSAGQPPAPAGGGTPGQAFDPNTSL